jgi:hypothetical protein
MHGITVKDVNAERILIEINIGKRACKNAPRSSTGKTYLVASTGSSMAIISPHSNSLRLKLHVTRKPNGDDIPETMPANDTLFDGGGDDAA